MWGLRRNCVQEELWRRCGRKVKDFSRRCESGVEEVCSGRVMEEV